MASRWLTNQPRHLASSVLALMMLIILGGCDLGLIRLMLGPSTIEAPPVLDNYGVVVSTLPLKRDVYVQHGTLGIVTDLSHGDYLDGEGKELAIVSETGTIFLDANKLVTKIVGISSIGTRMNLILVGPENKPHIMCRGDWGQEPGVFDLDGQKLWSLGDTGTGVDDMSAGDLTGDGSTEFVVGFNGGGGVWLLNQQGQRQWRKKDGNVWATAIVNRDGQGTMGIVHSNAGGEVTLRDAGGAIVNRTAPGPYFSDFTTCLWRGQGKKSHLLLTESDFHWILDCWGKVVAKLPATGCGDLSRSVGTLVQFRAEGPPHFAVLTEYALSDASALWIYDAAGTLVFLEVLAGAGEALLPWPDSATNTETLMVGSEGKVLHYTMAPVSAAPSTSETGPADVRDESAEAASH